MGGVCKGICQDYEFDKNDYPIIEKFHGFNVIRTNHSEIYGNGGKRCSVCEIYLDYPERNCPCCGMQLRISPKLGSNRNGKAHRY